MADFTAGQVLTAAQLDAAFNTFTINTQTGTTYTLGAADAGEMVTINNNSGGTVTIPTNATTAFATGTHISVLNNGTAGTFTVAGAGGVTFTSDVTTLAPWAVITVVKTATNTWYGVAGGSGKASVSGTTGSPSVDTSSRPGKTIYTFNGSGSITVASAGLVEIRVCGGGGGGQGARNTQYEGAGGGGGGHVVDTSAYLPAGTHTVTVGAGGAAGAGNVAANGDGSAGSPGFASLVARYVAIGGGGGGAGTKGGRGGSGGGGCGTYGGGTNLGNPTGGLADAGQGNNGAVGSGLSTAGGGGGAGAAGSGTTGGAGLADSITGSSVTRCAGGNAATGSGSPGGANTGNGGAGGLASSSSAGSAGGSGQVIIVIG
jgi:hypothetical protein